jgi:hypothetical protein
MGKSKVKVKVKPKVKSKSAGYKTTARLTAHIKTREGNDRK